jgi:hypothetical protein
MPKYSSKCTAFCTRQGDIVMGMYMGLGLSDHIDEHEMHKTAAKFLAEYQKQYRLRYERPVDWTAQCLDEASAALALDNLPLAKSKTRRITWDEAFLIRGAVGPMMPPDDDAAPSAPMLLSNGDGDVAGPNQPQVICLAANGDRVYHTFTAVPVDLDATDYAPTRLLVKRKTTEPAEPDAEPDSATKKPKYAGEEEPTSQERSQEERSEEERSQPTSEELIVVGNLKDEHGNTLSDAAEDRYHRMLERTQLETLGLHESIVIDDDEEPDYGPEPVSYVNDQDVFVKAECLRHIQCDSPAPFDICGFRAKFIGTFTDDATEFAVIRFLVVPGTTQNALYGDGCHPYIEHTTPLPLSLIAPCH